MFIRKYTIVAIPDVEKLSSSDYINETDVIVEGIIATSYIKALARFKDSLKSEYYYHQISFPVEKYKFFEVTKRKVMSQQSIRLQHWKSIEVAATKHNNLVLREQYLEISRTAKANINENDPRKILDSLDNNNLRDIYDKARSNSFLLLRQIASFYSPYNALLVLDIGDAFHNHHHIINDSYGFHHNIITDLLLYEQWIYTLKELRGLYNFHLISSYTISEIIADLQIQH